MSRLLLLSGGLDSSAIAAVFGPERCLFVNYGQRAADAEQRAANAVAAELALPLDAITVDASPVGAGLMTTNDDIHATQAKRSPEWWPFRNQLLLTLGASWAVTHGLSTVLIGTVATDQARHRDGTSEFLERVNGLTAMQEGNIHIEAPAARQTTAELISQHKVREEVLRWTHSCHRANLPCANCPGCAGRAAALRAAGRLQ